MILWKICCCRHLFPLPRLTADGYRVFYSGLHPSASNFCHLTHCRSLVNLTDYCVSNDSITNGTYIIIDGKNITFKLLKQFPTSQFLKASSYVTVCIMHINTYVYIITSLALCQSLSTS